MDEYHPALSADGRFLVFTRAQLQPQLNGNIVPPGERTLVMVDRSTGQVKDPLGASSDGSTSNGGTGATITKGPNGQDRLAFGLRQNHPIPANSTARLLTAARLDPPSFFPITADHLPASALRTFLPAEPNRFHDVTSATLAQTPTSRIVAWTSETFDATTGATITGVLEAQVRNGSSDTPAKRFQIITGNYRHPALRPSDGYLVWDEVTDMRTKLVTSDVAAEQAPPAINTTARERMPAWSPDGLKLGFVRSSTTAGARILQIFDATVGLQTTLNDGLNIGAAAPTTQLRDFHERWGGTALALETRPDSVGVTCSGPACLVPLTGRLVGTRVPLQPVLTGPSTVGIVVARVTGSTRLLGRRVPRIKALGRVPLGSAQRGRASFRWNGEVAGRKLKPGTYVLVFRALTSRGRVRATSDTIRFKVTRSGRIASPRVIR
jgi:hypothetical protein